METERLIPMTEAEVRDEIERQLAALGSAYRPQVTIAERVRTALFEHVKRTGRPARVADLMAATGAKNSTVSVAVMRMKQTGEIVGGGTMGFVPRVIE